MRSEILIPELTLRVSTYRDIRAESPTESFTPLFTPLYGDHTPLLKVPFFDGDGRFIGNLLRIHLELSPIHFSVATSIFGAGSRGTSEEELIEGLISRGLAVRTVYSYNTPGYSNRTTPILEAAGEFRSFIEESNIESSAGKESMADQTLQEEPQLNNLTDLILYAAAQGASDIHLDGEQFTKMDFRGSEVRSISTARSAGDLLHDLRDSLTPKQLLLHEKGAPVDLEGAVFGPEGAVRYIAVLFSHARLSAVIRLLPRRLQPSEEGVPNVSFSSPTGLPGSGKSDAVLAHILTEQEGP